MEVAVSSPQPQITATSTKKRKPRTKKNKASEKGAVPTHTAADLAAIVSGVPPGEFAPVPTQQETDAVYMYTDEKVGDDEIAKSLEKFKDPSKKRKKKKVKRIKKAAAEEAKVKEEHLQPLHPTPFVQREASPHPLPLPLPQSPIPHQEPPKDDDVWYREQEIFHDFVPQSVEAQIMASQRRTRDLADMLTGLADVTMNQIKEFSTAVERTLPKDEGDETRLDFKEKMEELTKINKALRKNLRTIGTGLSNCASALYSLNTTSKAVNSKHRALFRNIRSHLYNSYIFDANTPGSSLLLDPSVPQ